MLVNHRCALDKIKSVVLQVVSVALFSVIAELIRCDYGIQGILFISAFYVCRSHRVYQVLLFLLAYMGGDWKSADYVHPFYPVCSFYSITAGGETEIEALFYVFYPLHITILYLFRLLLEKSMIT